MLEDLTERERAVLEARIAGEQLKAIAARLGIDEKTVWEYQDRATRKIGARSLEGARRRFQQLLRDQQVASATS